MGVDCCAVNCMVVFVWCAIVWCRCEGVDATTDCCGVVIAIVWCFVTLRCSCSGVCDVLKGTSVNEVFNGQSL